MTSMAMMEMLSIVCWPKSRLAAKAPSQKKQRSVKVSKAMLPQVGGKVYFLWEGTYIALDSVCFCSNRGPKKL